MKKIITITALLFVLTGLISQCNSKILRYETYSYLNIAQNTSGKQFYIKLFYPQSDEAFNHRGGVKHSDAGWYTKITNNGLYRFVVGVPYAASMNFKFRVISAEITGVQDPRISHIFESERLWVENTSARELSSKFLKDSWWIENVTQQDYEYRIKVEICEGESCIVDAINGNLELIPELKWTTEYFEAVMGI